MSEIKKIVTKYRQMILYLFFGVATTLVNVVIYMICARTAKMQTIPATVCAWVAAVLFAYVTNRKWVFESSSAGFSGICRELAGFISCRALSGALDVFLMWLFVDVAGAPELLIKLLSNILVVIINYVASRFWIFKKE